MRSKTFVLALLRQIQEEYGRVALSVIRAALTRWISHFLAYRRLLDLKPYLDKLVRDDELRTVSDPKASQLVTGDQAAKQKSQHAISTIKDPTFWHLLVRLVIFIISATEFMLI